MEPLRVGLVGYGAAGRGIHGRLLREAGQRVTAVVTRGRGEQVEADWPGARVVPDLDAVLALASSLDLVVVASPTGEHVAHATAVLEAGLPVVVDKPLATDAAGAQRVLDAATRTGGRLTVFHNRRWDDEQRALRALLADGTLGRVHRFERRWERYRPEPMHRWKEQDPVGGGLLLDLGAHLVDSAVELFGPVEQVYAEVRSLTTPAPDDVFLALVHAPQDGAPAVVSHLQAGGLAGAPGPRTRVLGSDGAYLVTAFEGEPTPFAALDDAYEESRRPGEPRHQGWLVRGAERTPVPAPDGDGHVGFYRAVVRWLRDGGSAPVDPVDAVRTARVLDAARRSAREGQVVRLR
ncbi:Gfo/Idh/MocA family oxidoreductase [Cellulomonas massiliensis]|uniref:Gfo/Idh/MocA family oxidoreductase n=1 Tax=Cellulomonas massiliensis TaxID=1465811 RepID=UPI0003656C4B|nr:Gfo/Idh/MocA family oxidoreductase [Cellulomonas massiliensis]